MLSIVPLPYDPTATFPRLDPPFIAPLARVTGEPCKVCLKQGAYCTDHNPLGSPSESHKLRYTYEEVEAAIHVESGLITSIARLLECNHQTVHRYLERFPDLGELQLAYRELLVDDAEKKLANKLKNNKTNWPAIKFILSTLGKDRGYAYRQEITGKDGGPVQVEPTIPLSSLSMDKQRRILAILEEPDPLDVIDVQAEASS